MTGIPPSWDTNLEALLQTPNYQQAHMNWSSKVTDYVGNTKTFIEAINRRMPIGDISKSSSSLMNDSQRTREYQIRRIILAPLSPRKPAAVHIAQTAPQPKDRHQVEEIVRERKFKSTMSRLVPPLAQKDNTRLARESTIEKRTFSSLRPPHRTFYWGA